MITSGNPNESDSNILVKSSFEKHQQKIVFTISDGTGETAMTVVKAVMVQFEKIDFTIERFNNVRQREDIDSIVTKATYSNAIIVTTLVNSELRVYLLAKAMQFNLNLIDVLFPILEAFSETLGLKPRSVPGLFRQMDHDYYRRVQAIEFTVNHDDGLGLQTLADADVILLGVSRTSKTPLSMYLAYKGLKVANIPILPLIPLPKEVYNVEQNKIIGLQIEPERLVEIRNARMQTQNIQNSGSYDSFEKILEEIEWSEQIFAKNRRWPLINVTGKALEENAVEIERIIGQRVMKRTEN